MLCQIELRPFETTGQTEGTRSSRVRNCRDGTPEESPLLLPRLFVECMPSKFRTVLHERQALRPPSLLRDAIIPQSRFGTLKPNEFARHLIPLCYSESLAGHETALSGVRNAASSDAAASVFVLPDLAAAYSKIFVTTPDPTVRPPSRMAKRLPSLMAIGLPSSTSTRTLSPGMHISAPPRRFAAPVTSVVRK